MRARPRWLPAVVAVAALASCGEPAPTPIVESRPAPEQALRPGTVLVLGGVELGAAEVDRVAAWIAKLYPQSADAHNRRRALTTVLLPQVALARAHATAREHALESARGARAELAAGRVPAGIEVRAVSGTWGVLGLEIFGPAHDLAPGAWSEPLDGLGRVLLLRVLESDGNPLPNALVLRVEIVEFPFVPADSTQESIDRDIDTQRLLIVDPAWEQYVPLAWQHRLRATRLGGS